MAEARLNPGFQVGLDVVERCCLVIGGGREAEDKAGRLLAAGARVTLVSPRVTDQLEKWAAGGCLGLRRRRFAPGDLDGAFLVLNTVRSDPELARAVFAGATRRGALVNTYDQPAFSHFGMAALVAVGHLRLAISTSGASPSLARRLRQDLEGLFDGEFAEYLEALACVRAHLRRTEPDFAERRRLLGELVADARLVGCLELPADWRRRVADVLGRCGGGAA